ncbi:MAG: SH3 domain-containing protein [Pseudomonadota bacterium]
MRTVLRSDGLNDVGAGFFSILAAVLLVFFSAGMNPCHGSSSDTSGTQLPEVGTVTASAGNLRSRPALDASIIDKVQREDKVFFLKGKGDWFVIKLQDGRVGWAHESLFMENNRRPDSIQSFLEKKSTETDTRATLAVDIGRIREAPSTDAGIKFKLIKGETVSVVETENDWYLIETEDGSLGWAHQSLFNEPVPAEASSAPAPAETVETPGRAEAPEAATPYDIKEIEFIMTPEREEIVSFLLSGYYPPNTFSVTKDSPKVICDFFNARLNSGIERYQEFNGKFIHQLRIGIHKGSRPKVRVILDLVSDEEYEIRPVFFKEDNLYTLIVAKKK